MTGVMDHLETKAAIGITDAGEITALAWSFASADRYGDIITKGAFTPLPAKLPMLFSHDPDQVIGVWDQFAETAEGLEVKGRLFVGEVARADEVRTMVLAGAVQGISIGFYKRDWSPRPGQRGRTIRTLDLAETSLVSVPAHPRARIRTAKNGATAIALAAALNRFASKL